LPPQPVSLPPQPVSLPPVVLSCVVFRPLSQEYTQKGWGWGGGASVSAACGGLRVLGGMRYLWLEMMFL
jgi:hypothetical protein